MEKPVFPVSKEAHLQYVPDPTRDSRPRSGESRAAARNFDQHKHFTAITLVSDELTVCEKRYAVDVFNRARRRFYRVLLDIAGNRELRRLFLTIHMEIIHAQYQSPRLQEIRFADYRVICMAVIAGDVKAAAAAGSRRVRLVSELVRSSV